MKYNKFTVAPSKIVEKFLQLLTISERNYSVNIKSVMCYVVIRSCALHDGSWCFVSDLGLGQTQDDSIVGLKQTKHAPPTATITGSLSSSNPDLAQGQQRIIDYSMQPPGKRHPLSNAHCARQLQRAETRPWAAEDSYCCFPSCLTFLCSANYIVWVGSGLLNMSVSHSNFSSTLFSLTAPGFTREYSCTAGGFSRDTDNRLTFLAAFLDTSLRFAFLSFPFNSTSLS